ncbi:MAG: DUF5716 family protein [Eubacteriales bacterium]|nr:DUF5716 family protein [Eubacteriales bacterium]
MNEIRDLIIGLDFGKDFSQISYYDRKAEEPCSVAMKVGTSQWEAPTLLCRRAGQEDYCVGLEAEYFAREKGGELVEALYERSGERKEVELGDQSLEPWKLAAFFIKGMLKLLGVMDVVKNTRCLVVTARELTPVRVENLQRACEYLGFTQETYLLLDYGESFFYYALTQKRETWNRSVGWYDFSGDQVEFRRLSMNGAGRPVLVRLEEPVREQLSPVQDWEGQDQAKKRDGEFFDFAKKTLGTELYSSIQITGRGFDQQWAKKSVGFLCQQRRKVFYGSNLFAKGACAAGKEKKEDKRLKGYRYLSPALVLTDVGMDMRVMGSPAYYPLIEAGKNWYECRAACELILDDVKELAFVVRRFGEEEKKKVVMALPGLPARPNKTTRLSLSLAFLSPRDCEITVKDLGFGEMFPSTGKIWKEKLPLAFPQ